MNEDVFCLQRRGKLLLARVISSATRTHTQHCRLCTLNCVISYALSDMETGDVETSWLIVVRANGNGERKALSNRQIRCKGTHHRVSSEDEKAVQSVHNATIYFVDPIEIKQRAQRIMKAASV